MISFAREQFHMVVILILALSMLLFGILSLEQIKISQKFYLIK